MAFESTGGYVPRTDLDNTIKESLPILSLERVGLQFVRPSAFVAAQVANDAIFLAFATGRILRIDLQDAAEIEDIDLPKKPSEIGVIRRMFLDPTASHLIVTTTLGENYYLHSQSKQAKQLARLKGVNIESVAWNPSQPTASTREVLIGAADGAIYEIFIEPSTEFYRREEKYVKTVFRGSEPVVGLWWENVQSGAKSGTRRVLVATPSHLLLFQGKPGHEGGFSKFFEAEAPIVQDAATAQNAVASLSVSPEPSESVVSTDGVGEGRVFAWLSAQGVFHGELTGSANTFSEGRTLVRSQLPASMTAGGRPRTTQEPAVSMILTQWHIIQLVEGRIVATNRLDDTVVLDQTVLDPGQTALGLYADLKKNTFWLVTAEEVFEIVATDESRDVWKIMLRSQKFDAASQFARKPEQKDAVASASGDYLVKKGQYMEAATVYGRSSKPFEQVALTFIESNEQDALRKFLVTKLASLKKTSKMQRIMIGAWLVELYMAKLNILDDTITTQAELAEGMSPADGRDQLKIVRKEFQDFVTKYKTDLDVKTTYETISSHGREEELLFFAIVADDLNYVLSYWVQRERWQESLDVLKKQTDPDIFYKYSSVLMANTPIDLVDILLRQSNLDPQRLIPALLNYTKIHPDVPLQQNQAIRYLNYVITALQSTASSIHNTLISIYASSSSSDECALLAYLRAQSYAHEQNYDADFALRLCIQYNRVQSCVHIYSSMSRYTQAVALALKHNETDLAAQVADQSDAPPALRKKLWLAIAKEVISKSASIKFALDFLKRCDLLRIEDLIPFFPDFVVIDDFKQEICEALESYSKHIDTLKKEMDESALTASHIKSSIKQLDSRYAVVEPGEKCWICRLPLLARQFFVFPCQHSFHADCLAKKVGEVVGGARAKRIRDVQGEVQRAGVGSQKRERAIKELDGLVAGACVLCSEVAVKLIDRPFVLEAEKGRDEWAL